MTGHTKLVAFYLGFTRKGRLADLVIVDGDPLSDVSDLFNVTGVMRNGNYYTLEELLIPADDL